MLTFKTVSASAASFILKAVTIQDLNHKPSALECCVFIESKYVCV